MNNKLEIVVTKDNYVKATTPKSYYRTDSPVSNGDLSKALTQMLTIVSKALQDLESESENDRSDGEKNR